MALPPSGVLVVFGGINLSPSNWLLAFAVPPFPSYWLLPPYIVRSGG
jgi:hypothetical protein